MDSLRHRNFGLLWLSTLAVGGGFWGHQLVIGWLTFNLTGSPLLTAAVLGLDSLPFLLAAPVSGTIADLWDRRKTIAVVCGYQTALTAGFAVLVFTDKHQAWHIVGFVLLLSPSWSISEAGRASLIPNIVPKYALINAFGLREMAFNGTRLVLPAVAGVMIAVMGPESALVLVAALYLGAMAATLAMRTADVGRREARRGLSFTYFMQGVHYAKGEPVVLAVISLMFLPGLFIIPALQGLMPVYASDVYGVGPSGLGLLLSTIGVGALLGTFVIASLGNIRRKGRVLLGAVGVATVGMAAFSQVSSVALSLPVLIVASGGVSSFYALSPAIVQAVVPDHLRGRVWSLGAIGFGLMSVGGLLLGGLAEVVGPQTATLSAGAVMVVILALLWARMTTIWSLG